MEIGKKDNDSTDSDESVGDTFLNNGLKEQEEELHILTKQLEQLDLKRMEEKRKRQTEKMHKWLEERKMEFRGEREIEPPLSPPLILATPQPQPTLESAEQKAKKQLEVLMEKLYSFSVMLPQAQRSAWCESKAREAYQQAKDLQKLINLVDPALLQAQIKNINSKRHGKKTFMDCFLFEDLAFFRDVGKSLHIRLMQNKKLTKEFKETLNSIFLEYFTGSQLIAVKQQLWTKQKHFEFLKALESPTSPKGRQEIHEREAMLLVKNFEKADRKVEVERTIRGLIHAGEQFWELLLYIVANSNMSLITKTVVETIMGETDSSNYLWRFKFYHKLFSYKEPTIVARALMQSLRCTDLLLLAFLDYVNYDVCKDVQDVIPYIDVKSEQVYLDRVGEDCFIACEKMIPYNFSELAYMFNYLEIIMSEEQRDLFNAVFESKVETNRSFWDLLLTIMSDQKVRKERELRERQREEWKNRRGRGGWYLRGWRADSYLYQ